MEKYTIRSTAEYNKWLETQSYKSKMQISNKLERIKKYGHFGNAKHLDTDLYELKFNDGRRIYYTIIPTTNMILLVWRQTCAR